MTDLFPTNTAFSFPICWLLNWIRVDYLDVFISCLDSHSDDTNSLLRIFWANYVMHNFSKYVSMEKQNSRVAEVMD